MTKSSSSTAISFPRALSYVLWHMAVVINKRLATDNQRHSIYVYDWTSRLYRARNVGTRKFYV